MKVVRKLALGCLLAVALACATVSAAPQSRPDTKATAPEVPDNAFRVQLQTESAPLARQYVAAEKQEEKKQLRQRLSDTLSQQFDLHVKEQQKELEDLEKQIATLRSVLKKRIDAKATIVERRVEQLIQDAEGLGWNAPSSPRRGYGPDPYGRVIGLPEMKPSPK
jgi:DNA-binding transcriptional regulator YbjK